MTRALRVLKREFGPLDDDSRRARGVEMGVTGMGVYGQVGGRGGRRVGRDDEVAATRMRHGGVGVGVGGGRMFWWWGVCVGGCAGLYAGHDLEGEDVCVVGGLGSEWVEDGDLRSMWGGEGALVCLARDVVGAAWQKWEVVIWG